jgi:hypothetical protein
MPDKRTVEQARKLAREGRSPSTQAGEFVREEMEHIREGKHGAQSTKQAIAIGLSKARRAGVKLRAPRKGTTSRSTRQRAQRDLSRGGRRSATSPRRSRATLQALRRKPRSAASHTALARQAKASARKRGGADRRAAARKAVRTKGPRERSQAARKAARTRARGR